MLLKTHKINKHPVSGELIPNEVFDDIEAIELDNSRTVEQYALDVFQKFGNNSISFTLASGVVFLIFLINSGKYS